MLSFSTPHEPGFMADLLCTVMLLCQGQNEKGESWWAYMCVKPRYAQAFDEACAKGAVRLEEYGTILESGPGAEPPAEVQTRMEQQFGMNHHFEADLLKALEQHS